MKMDTKFWLEKRHGKEPLGGKKGRIMLELVFYTTNVKIITGMTRLRIGSARVKRWYLESATEIF
jgi:hypothetical protein